MQIDRLNTELLSERARHEKHEQELRERHGEEMNLTRRSYEGEVSKLQKELERFKEGSVQV